MNEYRPEKKLILVATLILCVFLLPACTQAPYPTIAITSTSQPAATNTQESTVEPSPTSTIEISQTFTLTPEPTAVVQPTATSKPLEPQIISPTMVSNIDGMEMVYIPAGVFIMGSSADVTLEVCAMNDDQCQRYLYLDEEPPHKVYLYPYWIDKTEVTVAMYRKCVNAGVCTPPFVHDFYAELNFFDDPDFDNYPVFSVSKTQSQTYCEWVGRTLPTEAQWEKAARGTDARNFPWGNEMPNENLASFQRLMNSECFEPVGSYPAGASPYGVLDMAGNADEWVADFYDEEYYAVSPEKNPTGPAGGYYNIHRGGSCNNYPENIISVFRFWDGSSEDKPNIDAGFRCSMQAQVEEISVPDFERTLKIADPLMAGEDVKIIQTRLFELGYFEIEEADGVFGTKTDSAVRKFQERNNLVVDGIVGPLTWNALFDLDAAISD